MKIVFMGTPDYAAGALEALIQEGHEITAVVTQPDKPKGRSKELQYPPVRSAPCATVSLYFSLCVSRDLKRWQNLPNILQMCLW